MAAITQRVREPRAVFPIPNPIPLVNVRNTLTPALRITLFGTVRLHHSVEFTCEGVSDATQSPLVGTVCARATSCKMPGSDSSPFR